jgi:nickel/cobalt transporter (NicO) family protein
MTRTRWLSIWLALGPIATALAHPLGNFTTNRHATIEVTPRQVAVEYVVDFAEIPSFRELRELDPDGDGVVADADRARYLAQLGVTLSHALTVTHDDQAIPLVVSASRLERHAGASDLPTLRVEIALRGAVGGEGGVVRYRDTAFADRPGWREVVARGAQGVAVTESTVPAIDRSQQLRAYPQDLQSSPPAVHTAEFRFTPGAAAPTAPRTATGATTDGRLRDRLTELVATTEPLAPGVIFVSLLIAAGLGALHALTPGHGKSVVGAYLVGSRGTWQHAVFLGLVVTATHTLGVYALGLITLTASHWILPEQILPWLSIGSGLLVLGIGANLVVSRLANAVQPSGHEHANHDGHDHGHAHSHPHGHDHHHGEHGHSHLPPTFDGGVTWRSLLALGVSGGILPCPSALVVMLGAIALGRVAFGMLLIVAFSTGLAAVLTSIGLLMVYARRAFDHLPLDGRFARYMPVASAVVISIAGLLILVEALGQIGI